MIDENGYRANICILLTDGKQRVFWGRRIGQNAWQFPQGGVNEGEDLDTAMYRELNEEIGLKPEDVAVLASTNSWLKYRLPTRLVRQEQKPVCIGQKQWWYLLQLISSEDRINLNCSNSPEFDGWRWVKYWYPLSEVVAFKRDVYRRALKHFTNFIFTSEIEKNWLTPIFSDMKKY